MDQCFEMKGFPVSAYSPQPYGQQDQSASGQGVPGPVPNPPQQAPYPPQGYQNAYPPAPSTPQRNQLLFVVSILLIIGAAINLIMGLGLVALMNSYNLSVSQGMVTFSVLLAFIGAVLLLVVGILGIRNAANPAKSGLLVSLGIGLVIFALLNSIVAIAIEGFSVGAVTGFLLPVLFLVGAFNLKKQA